jgi:tetratricopeptide (TPR) repeat protein
MKRLTFAIALFVPALAWAQPQKTPDQYFQDGETQYNLGNFTAAIEAFKAGFAAEPDPSKKAAYLHNIAQSYRQAKDCSQAQFFYKRYLALKDSDTKKPLDPKKRQDIEDRIKELEDCARQQEAIAKKPPENVQPDGGQNPNNTTNPKDPKTPTNPNNKVATTTKPPDDEDEDGVSKTVKKPGAHLLSARLVGGGAKISTGDLDVPLQATAALIAGYPIPVNDQITVDAGIGFTFTPVPYENAMNQSKSAQLIGVLADAGATYHVNPKIGVRGDVGLGMLVFSGVSESPFTNNAPTSGALTMFHIRVGVSADYAITPNVIATVAPFAFSFSPPKEGLRDDIKSITAIDFMVGLGYRM